MFLKYSSTAPDWIACEKFTKESLESRFSSRFFLITQPTVLVQRYLQTYAINVAFSASLFYLMSTYWAPALRGPHAGLINRHGPVYRLQICLQTPMSTDANVCLHRRPAAPVQFVLPRPSMMPYASASWSENWWRQVEGWRNIWWQEGVASTRERGMKFEPWIMIRSFWRSLLVMNSRVSRTLLIRFAQSTITSFHRLLGITRNTLQQEQFTFEFERAKIRAWANNLE